MKNTAAKARRGGGGFIEQYDATGLRTGWVREEGDRQMHFNADGLLVLSQDRHRRPARTRVLRYERDPIKSVQERWHPRPLRMVLGDFIIHYRYMGSADQRGAPERVERAADSAAATQPAARQ